MAKKKVKKKAKASKKKTSKKKAKKPAKKKAVKKVAAKPAATAAATTATEAKPAETTATPAATEAAPAATTTATEAKPAEEAKPAAEAKPAEAAKSESMPALDELEKKSEFSLESPSKGRLTSEIDITFLVLIIGLAIMPISYFLLYINIYPQFTWLPYVLLGDILVVTAMFFFKRTILYAFLLNCLFFLFQIIIHAFVIELNGVGDFLLLVPDFAMGFALWKFYKP